MKRRLYLYVTDDKYELPLVVADSVAELARKVGRNESSISSMISKRARGIWPNSRFVRVDLEEEE